MALAQFGPNVRIARLRRDGLARSARELLVLQRLTFGYGRRPLDVSSVCEHVEVFAYPPKMFVGCQASRPCRSTTAPDALPPGGELSGATGQSPTAGPHWRHARGSRRAARFGGGYVAMRERNCQEPPNDLVGEKPWLRQPCGLRLAPTIKSAATARSRRRCRVIWPLACTGSGVLPQPYPASCPGSKVKRPSRMRRQEDERQRSPALSP